MATGVLSTAMLSAGWGRLSDVLLWITVGLWLGLAAIVVLRRLRRSGTPGRPGHAPAVLTAAAATAVTGTRLTAAGHPALGVGLLALAALAWLRLVPRWWRSRPPVMVGADFLAVVSTNALAVLCAALAVAYASVAALTAGTVLLAAGVALYAPVLRRFDVRQVATGRGDHWIAGGALAIGALAAAELGRAGVAIGAADAWTATLRATALVLIVAAVPWYAALAIGELARPRPAGDMRRWSTVFPLGVAAAACMALGRTVPRTPLSATGRGLAWVALGAGILVALMLLFTATPPGRRGTT